VIRRLVLFYLPILIAQIFNLQILAFIYIPTIFIFVALYNIKYGIEIILFLIPFSFVYSKVIASALGFGTLFIDNDVLVFILFLINAIQYKYWINEKINYRIPLLLLFVFGLGIINIKDIRLYLAELQRWIFLGLFAFVLIKRINKIESFNSGLKSFLFGGLLASILGLSVHFGLFKFPDELGGITYNRDSFINSQADFVRYMGSGGFFIMFIFPLFFLTRLNRLIRINNVFSIFSSIPLILSFRRSAYMALFAAIIFLAIFYYKLNWKKIFVPVLALGIIFFVGSDFKLLGGIADRFISALTPQNDFTFMSRVSYWLGAIGMFRDHPMVGVGLNQIPAYYSQYITKAFDFSQIDISYGMQANSDYLQYLATTGIFGFSVIFLFIVERLKKYSSFLIKREENIRPYIALAISLLIGILIFSIVEDPLMDKNFMLFAVFCITNIEKTILKLN